MFVPVVARVTAVQVRAGQIIQIAPRSPNTSALWQKAVHIPNPTSRV
jgi:hypothetical protein